MHQVLVCKSNVCFNCLGGDHKKSDCSSKNSCFHSGCTKKHHTTLHEFFTDKDEKDRQKKKAKKGKNDGQEDEKENESEAALTGLNIAGTMGSPGEAATETELDITSESAVARVNFCSTKGPRKSVILLIVAVTVHVGDKSFDTYALLDDGSQSTLLRREFFDKMGVKGKPKKILETTVKDDPQPVTVDELSMVVSARDGTNSLEIKSVLVQPTDMFNMPSRPRVEANSGKTYSHLQGLEFDAVKAEDISLLIGCNAPKAHLYDATRTGGDEDPIAIRTRFGWTLFGPSVCNTERGNMHCSAMLTDEVMDQAMESFWENEDPPTIFTNKLAISSTGDPLHEAVEMFWQQEHCGILPQKDVAMSREDMDALEEMDKKTKLVNNRYEVPMLWADPNPSLPPNLPMAKRR